MLILFVQGTLLDDLNDLVDEVQRASTICFIMLFFVIVLAAMTMMNMLVGILCEVVSSVAKTEREAMAMLFIRDKVLETLNIIDQDGDNQISKDEFMAIIEHPVAVAALTEAGVDVISLVDIADVIFQSDRQGEEFDTTLDFDSFMVIVMKFCGTNYATTTDLVDIKKLLQGQSSSIHDIMHRIMRNQKVIADRMKEHFKEAEMDRAKQAKQAALDRATQASRAHEERDMQARSAELDRARQRNELVAMFEKFKWG